MDPNATLARIRELQQQIADYDYSPETVDALNEAVGVLDDWLSKGGFFPTAWSWNGST